MQCYVGPVYQFIELVELSSYNKSRPYIDGGSRDARLIDYVDYFITI